MLCVQESSNTYGRTVSADHDRFLESFLEGLCVFMLNASNITIIYNFFVPQNLLYFLFFVFVTLPFNLFDFIFNILFLFLLKLGFCFLLAIILFISYILLVNFFFLTLFHMQSNPTNMCTFRLWVGESFEKHGIAFELAP